MVTARKIAALGRKDLRHAWPQLLVALPLLFIFATHDLEPLTRHKSVLVASLWQLLFVATPLAIWSLVATTIQSEPLIGDRQYWLTRPFTWYHLAAAKLAVIALCINLPLFLFQAIALGSNGLSLLSYFPALLWRQVFFSALVLLPAVAMAAITRTQGQFALLILLSVSALAGLAWIGWTGAPVNSGTAVDGDSRHGGRVACRSSGAIVVLQYARRRAALARWLLAFTVVACFGCMLVPWEAVSPARGFRPGLIELSLDRRIRQRGVDSLPDYLNVAIELPLLAQGVPPGGELALNYYRISLENPERPEFHPVVDFVRLHGWDGHAGFLMIVLSPAGVSETVQRA